LIRILKDAILRASPLGVRSISTGVSYTDRAYRRHRTIRVIIHLFIGAEVEGKLDEPDR